MGAGIAALVAALVRVYSEPQPVLHDPCAIVLHENACYLVDDDRRDALYSRLIAQAPAAAALLAADHDALLDRARWRDAAGAARRALARNRGDHPRRSGRRSTRHAARLALPRANPLLARYPAIGAPGVDRILLFGHRRDAEDFGCAVNGKDLRLRAAKINPARRLYER